MPQRIQLRRGTAAEWTMANPVLESGEPGVELDTDKVKVGDGTSAWDELDYAVDSSVFLAKSANLSDLPNATTARTNLGLGTAATAASGDFDAAGAAAAAQAASQPLDADLSAIAALTTTSFGRSLLALADALAGRTALALGTAATANTGAFDPAGSAATAQAAAIAASQPLDSDLTAIAALSTTSYGRSLLALADAAAVRTAIGLSAATVPFTPAGTIAATTVQAAIEEVAAEGGGGGGAPSGPAGGVLGGTYPDPSYAVDMATQSELDAAIAGRQPLDSDLTAIAALTTTSFGRAFLSLADAAAGRTALGLGTMATQAASGVAVTGGTVTGITDLAVADGGTGASTASGARTNLGLGSAAVANVGTTAGTVAAGDDGRFSGGGVTVQDEGSPLATAGTTLNFVGGGVVASGSGSTKTITVAGGAGGTAAGTTFTPAGSIAASDVQAAIQELDTEKLDFDDPLTLVSVTGAATLTTGAFGKLHICSGTTYTVVLPTAVGNTGAVIALKVTATGILTVDGNGSQTIDGALTLLVVAGEAAVLVSDGANWVVTTGKLTDEVIVVAITDETTAITTGVAKVTMRMPFAMVLTALPRLGLTTASSSGLVTVDINEGGSSILSTKLSVDAGEETSTTAATPAVLSDTALVDNAEITFDVDAAGTGATGAKVTLIGKRV